MDVSVLGPAFYLLFIIPGFIAAWSLLLLFGSRMNLSGFEWTCWSILSGILVFMAWQWLERGYPDQIERLITNPVEGTLVLSVFAFALAVAVRLAVLAIKWIAIAIMATFAFSYAVIDEIVEERRKDKMVDKLLSKKERRE